MHSPFPLKPLSHHIVPRCPCLQTQNSCLQTPFTRPSRGRPVSIHRITPALRQFRLTDQVHRTPCLPSADRPIAPQIGTAGPILRPLQRCIPSRHRWQRSQRQTQQQHPGQSLPSGSAPLRPNEPRQTGPSPRGQKRKTKPLRRRRRSQRWQTQNWRAQLRFLKSKML